jgi:omega-amidase
VAAVNRAGTDGNGHRYAGGSAVIDALGVTVVECDEASRVVDATVSLGAVQDYRTRFPAHLDADRFTLG